MAEAPLAEIRVVVRGEVVQRVPLGIAPLHVGRAHTNGVVLDDARVSAHHAVFWQDADGLWVEDMNSRNGTAVNGERLAAPRRLVEGDTVQLGADTMLHVAGAPEAVVAGATGGVPCLEDLDAGVRFPLWTDRFHIGSAPDADLRLEHGPDRLATLLVYDASEVWLGVDGKDEPLEPGQEIVLGGRRYRLGAMTSGANPTTGMAADRYPYRIVATLNGAAGPEAEVEELQKRRYRVEADTRAILLYLLARKLQTDRAEHRPGEEAGWCTDGEVAQGIWGRSRPENDTNSLNVLVHRVRKELVGAGFEPWFIEKRRRRIRVRVADVAIV